MPTLQIGEGGEWLRLTVDASDPQYLQTELHAAGLSASRPIFHEYAPGLHDLGIFFDHLAEDWRGWEGVRVWESIERELSIEARHRYGHVQLRIRLRCHGPGWGNDGWKAMADLTIDPGEELSREPQRIRYAADRQCP